MTPCVCLCVPAACRSGKLTAFALSSSNRGMSSEQRIARSHPRSRFSMVQVVMAGRSFFRLRLLNRGQEIEEAGAPSLGGVQHRKVPRPLEQLDRHAPARIPILVQHRADL